MLLFALLNMKLTINVPDEEADVAKEMLESMGYIPILEGDLRNCFFYLIGDYGGMGLSVSERYIDNTLHIHYGNSFRGFLHLNLPSISARHEVWIYYSELQELHNQLSELQKYNIREINLWANDCLFKLSLLVENSNGKLICSGEIGDESRRNNIIKFEIETDFATIDRMMPGFNKELIESLKK